MVQMFFNTIMDYNHTMGENTDTFDILIQFTNSISNFINIKSSVILMSENKELKIKLKNGNPVEWINLIKLKKMSIGDIFQLKKNKPTIAKLIKIGLLKKVAEEKDICMITFVSDEEILGLAIIEYDGKKIENPNIIKMLTGQTTTALKWALYVEHLNKIDEVAAILNTGLHFHSDYSMFVDELKKLVDFDRVSITIPDLDNDIINIYTCFDRTDLQPPKISFKGSALSMIINTANYLIENDLSKSGLFTEDNYLNQLGHKTILRLPLISKGNVIGTLNIAHNQPDAYEQKNIKTMLDLSSKIASTVENALVYDVVNQQLHQLMKELNNTHNATLEAFMVVLDAKDSGTKGHCNRVVEYTTILAKSMGYKGKELDDIKMGAMLHDIGKISIPDSVLFKNGDLNAKQWNIIKTHPQIGFEMVSKINFFKKAAPIVFHHHEKYDGTGYPKGLKGAEIPRGARIFAIADAFDAMTSDRPYRASMSLELAREEIIKHAGGQFDPHMVEKFLSCLKKFTRLINKKSK